MWVSRTCACEGAAHIWHKLAGPCGGAFPSTGSATENQLVSLRANPVPKRRQFAVLSEPMRRLIPAEDTWMVDLDVDEIAEDEIDYSREDGSLGHGNFAEVNKGTFKLDRPILG